MKMRRRVSGLFASLALLRFALGGAVMLPSSSASTGQETHPDAHGLAVHQGEHGTPQIPCESGTDAHCDGAGHSACPALSSCLAALDVAGISTGAAPVATSPTAPALDPPAETSSSPDPPPPRLTWSNT